MSKKGGNPQNLTYRIPKDTHISYATEFKKRHTPFPLTKKKLKERGKKISLALKGRIHSEETRKKISTSLTGKFRGQIAPWVELNMTQNHYRLMMNLKKKEEIAKRPRAEGCEICLSPEKTYFDHCHKTGKFRGWICRRCHLTLGALKDDVRILELLIDYLKSNE